MVDKAGAAVCGLFCPSCTKYIKTRENRELRNQSGNKTGDEVSCDGCRAYIRTDYCMTCKISLCAKEKGIDFCCECPEYPCECIKGFQSIFPHRIELFKNQERIRTVGYEKWYEEMIARYSCPECGAINSAYDTKCRGCGHDPSCAYVAENREEILRRSAPEKSG